MNMPQKGRWLAFLAVIGLGVGVGVGGCGKAEDPWPAGRTPRLLVTIPPLYSFAINVAGDRAAVISLLKHSGPHDYQPAARDSLKLRGAERFYIVGLDLDDSIATRLRDTSGNPNLSIVKLGDRVKNKIKEDKAEHHGDKEAAGGHEHHHGEYDPHVWLGIPEAIEMVEGIRDDLKIMKPAIAGEYDRNAKAYIAKLNALLDHGRKTLEKVPKENRKLVSFHDSLEYFGRSLDLEIAGVVEKQPGVEVNAQNLRQLVDICTKDKVRVIAIEPQYPAKGAEMLVDQIGKKIPGAQTVVVDPLETSSPEDFGPEHQFGKDFYERKMKENFDNLAKALK